MEALSFDLRERVVAACDEGVSTRSEIAGDFGVSVSFITKLLRRRKRTGSIAAKPHAGGFAPRLAGEALGGLQALVQEQPDATLAELCQRLKGRQKLCVSEPTVCRALARLGLPRKKSACTPASGIRHGSGANAARSHAK